jgi:hypothetical protein
MPLDTRMSEQIRLLYRRICATAAPATTVQPDSPSIIGKVSAPANHVHHEATKSKNAAVHRMTTTTLLVGIDPSGMCCSRSRTAQRRRLMMVRPTT